MVGQSSSNFIVRWSTLEKKFNLDSPTVANARDCPENFLEEPVTWIPSLAVTSWLISSSTGESRKMSFCHPRSAVPRRATNMSRELPLLVQVPNSPTLLVGWRMLRQFPAQ